MAKYKTYPEYKDSGVEWLGKVPKDWNILSLKSIALIVNGSTPKSGVEEYWDGDINWITPTDLSQTSDVYLNDSQRKITYQGLNSCGTSLVPEDTVILSTRAPIGSLAITTIQSCTNQGCKSLVVKNKIHSLFLYYYLSISTNSLNNLGRGSTFLELSTEDLGSFKVSIPDIGIEKIVTFLSYETAKIDSLIEKQQQLIELLKEKRQAVISHAVTKGLNPDVPMKDSGVEWLGEVPEHWDVTRAKFISKIFVPQRNKPELNNDSGVFWVTMENMNQHYITFSHQRVSDTAALKSGSKILPRGAVIASCVGNFGVAAINEVDVIINQQLQAFQPECITANYLMTMVSISKNYFELIGTAATLVYVNKEGFENLPILVPPYDEQVDIYKFININNEKFELLIEYSINQINLLQERRTALISAAVTGKIDVRDWVAPDTQETEKTEETAK